MMMNATKGKESEQLKKKKPKPNTVLMPESIVEQAKA